MTVTSLTTMRGSLELRRELGHRERWISRPTKFDDVTGGVVRAGFGSSWRASGGSTQKIEPRSSER